MKDVMIPVRVEYFEEGPSWTEKRSAAATAAAAASATKTFSVSSIDLSERPSSATETESLCSTLTASSPSFVFVHNATPVTRQQMMQLPYVRKMYGITSLVRYEPRDGSDRGTVALVRVNVNCESVDNAAKALESGFNVGSCVRMFMILQVRSFAGASMVVSALYIDPSALPRQRVAVLTSLVPQLGNAELLLLVSNLFSAHSSVSSEAISELQAACTAKGFSDAAEETGDRGTNPQGATVATTATTTTTTTTTTAAGGCQPEWSVWLKSAKLTATHLSQKASSSSSSSASWSAAAGNWLPATTTVTLAPRPATTITIPQPRSAKSVNSRGSPSLSATPAIMTDPAILSAEAAGKGVATTAKGERSAVIERLLQQQQQRVPRWRASNAYTLKSNEKLNSNESSFDISAHFSSVSDAVEALNNQTIHWPADYCVVHNVILANDNVVQGDKRVMFRRYARDYKNSSALISRMFVHAGKMNSTSINVNNSAHGLSQDVASEKTSWLKHVTAMTNHTNNETNSGEISSLIPASRALGREEEMRIRSWEVSWCTIVYQVTPREMKFDITPAVGLGKDNLKEAIQWLNLPSQSNTKTAHGKENPLRNHACDYALLFSTELQGYYLIAATHVPCDIVACRAAA